LRPKLILASTSPRRREIFARLGLPFESIAPTFEELSDDVRDVKEETLFFAESKARSVMHGLKNHIVIGSDTLIAYQGQKIGKPENAEAAKTILKMLQGRSHEIYTAVFVMDVSGHTQASSLEKVKVRMHEMSEAEIEDYVATKEPLDKAGAYAVQGIGSRFIRELKGDRLAAIGLPLGVLARFLSERGFTLPENLLKIERIRIDGFKPETD